MQTMFQFYFISTIYLLDGQVDIYKDGLKWSNKRLQDFYLPFHANASLTMK